MSLEEILNLVQNLSRNIFKYAEAERLRNGRIHAIKNCNCATALHPFGTFARIEPAASLSMLRAGKPFGAFKAL
ncbi:MAG TPA: hypothetical protein VGR76_15725, partial [Candidatus Angelobacter sp.]|nr:hypothetical protein [Candidatus Angelobacter sp.]